MINRAEGSRRISKRFTLQSKSREPVKVSEEVVSATKWLIFAVTPVRV